MTSETLDVELQFKKLPDQGADEVYDIWLYDQTRAGNEFPSRIEAIRVTLAARIPKLELSPREFVRSFRNLQGLTDRDGLQFGEWLHQWLFRELDGSAFELHQGSRIGLLWANPQNDGSRLSDKLFEQHESDIASQGQTLRFEVLPHRREATRQTLRELTTAHRQPGPALDVLSIVAHGSPGKLWLHQQGHADYPPGV
ncbi:MAG: hypothetical protein ACKV2Q_13125 [Planctomycetaceae bacterium]